MSDRLNQQALTLEEAQNEIRLAVKDAYFKQTGSIALRESVDKIIKRALMRIAIPSLREAARRSLVQYYYTQRQTVTRITPTVLALYISLLRLTDSSSEYTKQITVSKASRVVEDDITLPEIIQKGVPLQRYSNDVFKEYIKPVLDDMAKEEALDPDSEEYWGRRSSLRNRAEREVRHQGHVDNLTDLRSNGVKLVVISAHADCSDRCRPFQGRVFSLDGTSGVTPDGRQYEPIENATNIYTPNGKWKNGLFGFNCRHYAVAYKDGLKYPTVSVKTERREYAITERQRALERNVRKWKARAEMYKGTDRTKYKEAKAKARQWQGFYENYSRTHDRAYYPSRIRI